MLKFSIKVKFSWVIGALCVLMVRYSTPYSLCGLDWSIVNFTLYFLGSDIDTRRRAACDLVKGLSKFFEPQITSIFGEYVKRMLGIYNANPAQTWKSKDAAIYLVTSLATKAKTAKHGITKTNQLVDLVDFCRQHIIPELQKPNVDELPVLKAAAVKYIMTFRYVLTYLPSVRQ